MGGGGVGETIKITFYVQLPLLVAVNQRFKLKDINI